MRWHAAVMVLTQRDGRPMTARMPAIPFVDDVMRFDRTPGHQAPSLHARHARQTMNVVKSIAIRFRGHQKLPSGARFQVLVAVHA